MEGRKKRWAILLAVIAALAAVVAGTAGARVDTKSAGTLDIYGYGPGDDVQENRANYAAQQFGKKTSVLFHAAPRFNEFVVQTSEDPRAINERLLQKRIIGGFPLRKFYPELGNAALWCCTETTTRAQIDSAVEAVSG